MIERKWFDWSDAVEEFANALEKIQVHVLEHNVITDSAKVGANIDRAIRFLRNQ